MNPDTIARRSLLVLAFVAVLGYLAGFALMLRRGNYNTWAPMVIVPLLFAITWFVAVHEARRERDPWIVRFLMIALALKLLGAVARYLVAFDVYEGIADAGAYHRAGLTLSAAFRDGFFHFDYGAAPLVGTNFIRLVTGIVYTVTGPTRFGGFLVFSWLGFLGLFFFYRAFRVGIPDGDHRRYALFLFLLPSLLFWPSSIGKEAWMMLGLGLGAYGAARLVKGLKGGYVLLALGLLAVSAVRPHVALAVGVSALLAFLFRSSPGTDILRSAAAKLVGLALLVAASALLVGHAQRFLGIDNFDGDVVAQVLDKAEARTSQDGSVFIAPRVRSPGDVPGATLSVLFRPLPWEARNAGALVSSIEGSLLLAAFALSWRRLGTAARSVLRRPYLLFCVAYTIVFVVAFSTFGNFGIITRQRVQLFPFVLVVLALPVRRRRRVDPAQADVRPGALATPKA